MTQTTHAVWHAIDNDPCIQRSLRMGIANMRALTRYLIDNDKVDASPDAVMSAIRRYPGLGQEIEQSGAVAVANAAKLSTKSGIAIVAIIKDIEAQKLVSKLFSIINYARGEVLRIIQAEESIKIILDESNLAKVLPLIPKDRVIYVDKNIAEINMHVATKASRTPGVMSIISNAFSVNNINIVEVMSCVPELLWFVEDKDLLKAHKVLYELCRSGD